MNADIVISPLNRGLLYSTQAICLGTLEGAKKIACATPGWIGYAVKELARATPGLIADTLGPQIIGAGYDWVARPVVVGTHSLFWKKTNRPNAAFNAFALPVGKAIVDIPKISQAIDVVTNATSKVSDCVTDKIPETIVSKQSIQILKSHTKMQFLGYLQALIVYKLASAFFKVETKEPSIMAVIHPLNLVFIGFTIYFTHLIAYLQSENFELEQTETLPSKPIPTTVPIPQTPAPQLKKETTNQSESNALSKLLQPAKAPSWKERCFRTTSKTAISA